MIYSEKLSNDLRENYIERLMETSMYNAMIVTGELRDKQTSVQHIASFIQSTEDMNSPENMLKLSEICDDHYFKRIGIIYPDRNLYITDDLGENIYKIENRSEYFNRGMNGEDSIARLSADEIDDKKRMIFNTPLLSENEEIRGILFASYDLDVLRELISVDIFDGEGYSILFRKNGDKIIASTNAVTVEQDQGNIFKNLEYLNADNINIINKMKSDIETGISDLVKVDVYGEKYVYYQPLDLYGIYILTVVPSEIIESKYDEIMYSTYMGCIFLIIVFLIILVDIIKIEKKKKKELEKHLYVDELTNGDSYEKFLIDFNKWRSDKKRIACILMDIDNFRLINEIFGYEIGNAILQDIWNIINKNLQKKGIFARKYADRYVIMMEFMRHEEIVTFLERIFKDVKCLQTIRIEYYRILISTGVYVFRNNKEHIRHAESCAMMANRTIKNRYNVLYNFYSDDVKNKIIEKKSMMDKIYNAIKNKELYAYYQPKYDVKTKKIIGSEALIRWIKKDGTMVSPVNFIPIAEEVGLIVDIDKYMFDLVCKQQSIWKEKGIDILPISVNVSRNRLYCKKFIKECVAILNKYNLEPENIQFEITEGNLHSEEKVGKELVKKLTDLGFEVLIDDFGVGYSSISMIRDINATVLKIDKSFIDDMSDKGKNIIKHVINMSKIVNMKAVAEGVETKEQYEFLLKNDCEIIQGYYFAKPMSADEYEQHLR